MDIQYLGFFYFDPLYLMMIGPTILFALYAQMKVKGAYSRFSRVGTHQNYSGAEAAARILASFSGSIPGRMAC